MLRMPIVDLRERARALGESGRRVSVLWQDSESIGFLARGREYRSEFHIDPSDEVMLMIKGEMRLHYRTPEGKEEVAIIPEGSTIFTPAGIPHSPRFPPDAFVLVLERKRRPGEIDRFQWFCPKCDAFLHEERFFVQDYGKDVVSQAYQNFFDNQTFRTCKSCGTVMPKP
jgi:3-hydroxyanthranilate 3,4-dioxygenase